MSDFYGDVLGDLLKEGVLTREMRILVVCGGVPDREVLDALGFKHVVISNLDVRYDGKQFAPFEWSHQDAEDLKFRDGEFDFCLAHNGLHHCYSPHRALLEMYRVAKKGLLVFEPRDSLLTRIGVSLGFGQEFELSSVVGNDLRFGGVRNTFMPNYVYRWTEREIEKTISSFAPWGKHRFMYRYALRVPWDQLRARKNHSFYQIVRTLLPLVKLFIALFPKQANGFAYIVLKPRMPEDLHPWLDIEEQQIAINKNWAIAQYTAPK